MAENFSNLLKNINLHIQEAQQIPSGINGKRSTPRHIKIKIMKRRRQKVLNAARKSLQNDSPYLRGIQ